jgi:hypothetical protein
VQPPLTRLCHCFQEPAPVAPAPPTAAAPPAAPSAVSERAVVAAGAPEPPPVDRAAEELRAKLLQTRVKLLRLAFRLGETERNQVVAQVLYRLEMAEKLKGNRAPGVTLDRVVQLAKQAERDEPEAELDFTCTILLLGKSGVGKSATINSLLGPGMAATSSFEHETTSARPSLADASLRAC